MTNSSSKEKKPLLLERLVMQEEIQQLNQDVDRLTRLHEIGGLLNSTLDPEEILTKVVSEAVSIASAEEGLLMLLDETTNELFVRAHKGFQEDFVRRLHLKADDSIAQDTISTKRSQRLTNKDKILKLATGYYINAVVYVPLIVDSAVVGVLSVENRNLEKSFSENDEHLLNILANYAAVAIRNAQLVDNLTTRTNVLNSLHNTGRSILSISALGDVLEQIANEAFKLLKADSIVLYQYFSQSDDVSVPPIIRGDLKNKGRLGVKNYDHKQSSLFNLIKRGQPFYASDAKNDWIREGLVNVKDKLEDSFLFREEINSSAGIPLIANQEPMGLMFVNYHVKKLFSLQEKEIIALLSNQAAIAIQNARLLDDKEVRIKELAGLLETSSIMTSSPTKLKNVLKQVVKHTRKVINADYALVFPVDEKTGEFRNDLITMSGSVGDDTLVVHSPRPEGMTKKVKDEGLFIVEDAEDSEKYPFIERSPDSFIVKAGIRTIVGIALRTGQDFIGILYADFCQSRSFGEKEKQILQLFASQAAVSIQNARLFEKVDQHVNELSALNQIGQALSASEARGIDSLLKGIYEHTQGLMDVDNFYVALYDKDYDRVQFKIAINNGQSQIVGQGEYADRISGNGLTEYVIRTKQPTLILNDVDQWLVNHGVKKIGTDAKAWMGVPMLVGDKVLGVIAVQSEDQPFAYDENAKDILFTIASQTAIALENARLLQEQKLGLDELTALYDTSLDITRELDQEQLLKAIVKRAAVLLNAPGGGLLLCDAEKQEVEMKYTHNLDLMLGYKLKYGQSGAGRVAQTGRPLIINDYHHWDGRDTRLDKMPYRDIFKSVVQVPLKWQDEVIGVLYISDNFEGRQFIDKDVRLLERFANQVAIAIQNASLFDKKVKELEAMRATDLALLSVLALDEALEIILDELSNLTECNSILIRLYDDEKEELVLEASKGIAVGKVPSRINVNSGSISARAAKSGKILIAQDVQEDPKRQAFVDAISDPNERQYLMWPQSQASVPLIAKGRVIGVMTAQSHNQQGILQADIQLIESFARPAAIAIENARLFKETEHRALQLAAASEVTRDATTTLEVGKLLSQTVRLISERFGFYHAGIFLLKGEFAVLQAASSEEGHRMLEQGYKLNIDIGIVGFVAHEKKPRIALDVGIDTVFFNNHYLPNTRSEMALPLIVRDRVIGVLDVQSTKVSAFTEADKDILQIMTDQLSNAIENARVYKELEQTKGMVGARTALAWMGMTSSAWRHAIGNQAQSISEQADLLLTDLEKASDIKYPFIYERLSMIQDLALQIKEKPITPPLSAEEGSTSVEIDELISERTKQLWESEPYRSIKLYKELELDKKSSVRASSEWLRRALDVLIDNAINAMADTEQQQIRISTKRKDNHAEILISDTGIGISKEIAAKLFHEPINKMKGSEGLGMGLLIAQAIIQTYGGDIKVESTDPTGTAMLISLPLEI